VSRNPGETRLGYGRVDVLEFNLESTAEFRRIPMTRVFSVAAELLQLDSSDQRRLQAMLYFAQGWSLVLRESELFDDDLEAWPSGPVVRAISQNQHNASAESLGAGCNPNGDPLTEDDREFLRAVWESYRTVSVSQLLKMPRRESPWLKARQSSSDEISPHIDHIELEAAFAAHSVPTPLQEYAQWRLKQEQRATEQLAAIPQFDPAALLASSVRSGTGLQPGPAASVGV
jgi:uncharacterized phage-associated protein